VTKPKLKVSFGQSSNLAEIVRVEELAWEDFARRLTQQPPETDDKSSVGWYAVAEFETSHRDGKTFVARYALTLDYDHISREDVATITGAFDAHAYALYTTWSHDPAKPRLRLVLPLSRPTGADEFQAVSRKVASWAGIDLPSGESHVVAQMMFLPAVKPGKGNEFRARIHEGDVIDVDAVLGSYADWTDHSSWPHRSSGDNVYNADELPVPPDEKPGIVGDFCRAFDVPAVIEKFSLPYTPTNNKDRWTYTAGSRPEGAIIYDDGRKLHSHHDTDPARGQHNAFDLVRLHKFGQLDADVAAGCVVTERPSFAAMVKLALEQPEVRQQQIIAELDVVVVSESEDFAAGANDSPKESVLDAAQRASRFQVIPAAEFTGGAPLRWLIKSLLPKAQVGVIYGPSGAGKSFLALNIGTAVSRGEKWRELKTKKGRVVYVCSEGAGGFKLRVQAHSKDQNVPMEEMPDVIPNAPDLRDPKDAAAIAHAIGEADLVIVDTLAASFTGNENSGEDIGLVLRHCKFIHEKTGAMVWLVHHSGKDETKGARGWSGLRAAADVEMEVLKHDNDVRTVELTKLKDGEDGRKWAFRLKAVVLGTDEDGDAVSSMVVEAVELDELPSKRTGNSAEPTDDWEARVLQVTRRMSGPFELKDIIAGVIAKLTDADDPDKDRRVGRIVRATDDLLSAGHWLFKLPDGKFSNVRAVQASPDELDE
jgi:hypothetical protein